VDDHQFWLNLPADDHHFGYIIKCTKKFLLGEISLIKNQARSRGFFFSFSNFVMEVDWQSSTSGMSQNWLEAKK
jgi:hypothetical protein